MSIALPSQLCYPGLGNLCNALCFLHVLNYYWEKYTSDKAAYRLINYINLMNYRNSELVPTFCPAAQRR